MDYREIAWICKIKDYSYDWILPIQDIFDPDVMKWLFLQRIFTQEYMRFHFSQTISFVILFMFLWGSTWSCFSLWVSREEKSYSSFLRFERRILKERNIGKQFSYPSPFWDADCTRTSATYLGKVQSKQRTLKILLSTHLVSESCRAVSQIEVYNGENQYLWSYIVPTSEDLPDSLIWKTIMYSKNTSRCPKRAWTHFNLSKKLSETFFLPCGSENDPGERIEFYSFT